jgi:hypothetical protein
MSKDHYCPSQDWDRYCRNNYNPPREVNISLYFEWLTESFKNGFDSIFYYNSYHWFRLINSPESNLDSLTHDDFWYYLNQKYYSFEEYATEE